MFIVYLILAAGFGTLFVFLFKLWQKIDRDKNRDKDFEILTRRFDSVADSTNRALRETVESFTRGITSVSENIKQVHESVKTVSSFQDIFKSPKLRGRWGETSLESVLAAYFPKQLFSIQHYFKSGEAVDAALHLPNNLLLPIDSKFNWENFEKMVNAEEEISKDGFCKQFISDVKKKIDEIASKYILPSEGTVDMALMYVPAESVYYEIVHHIKEPDIAEYARKKKVVLVSPNTFYVTLSAIHHWFRDVHITRQTQEIIKRLSRVKIDAVKLGDNFRRLGKHISDASSAYDDSEKRLSLLTDRMENIVEMGSPEEEKTEEKESEI